MSDAARTNDSATKSTPSDERELEVLDVLAGERRHRDGDAGKVDALVRADLAADDDCAAERPLTDLLHLQADQTVVDSTS